MSRSGEFSGHLRAGRCGYACRGDTGEAGKVGFILGRWVEVFFLKGVATMNQSQANPGEAERRFEQQIEAVLEKIRPALQADGGDIELLAVEGRNARVRLVGACGG